MSLYAGQWHLSQSWWFGAKCKSMLCNCWFMSYHRSTETYLYESFASTLSVIHVSEFNHMNEVAHIRPCYKGSLIPFISAELYHLLNVQ